MKSKKESILVVGNGSSILNYRFGDIIDTYFEDVLRFNDYQVNGYEKYIGSKTTMWGRSNSRRTKDRNWGMYRQVIVASPEWNFNNVEQLVSGKTNAVVVPLKQALALQEELCLPGRKVGLGGGDHRGWPSTGLLILNYLTLIYPLVYIHGFDCFCVDGGSARHYYNNREKMQHYYVHNSDKEKKWIDEKIGEGKIKQLLKFEIG